LPILNFFAETARDEFSFYRRFEELPAADAAALWRFYSWGSRRQLFERICLFWRVRFGRGA